MCCPGSNKESTVETAAIPLEKAKPYLPFSRHAMVFSSSSLVGL